jgi:hypothetical protein
MSRDLYVCDDGFCCLAIYILQRGTIESFVQDERDDAEVSFIDKRYRREYLLPCTSANGRFPADGNLLQT